MTDPHQEGTKRSRLAASPLAGKLVLVPAARVGLNVLAVLLEREGANVVEFPPLRGAPPTDIDGLREAARRVGTFDWVVFSGELAVQYFFEQLGDASGAETLPETVRVGAIGSGAVRALRKVVVRADAAPREHTPEEVTAAIIDTPRRKVLLVRPEEASDDLPEQMRRAGLLVTEVDGFRVIADVEAPDSVELALLEPDLVAFGNPSAVRLFVSSAGQQGVYAAGWLRDTFVAAVGPATAAEARKHGIEPDLVSAGHLKDLMHDLRARE